MLKIREIFFEKYLWYLDHGITIARIPKVNQTMVVLCFGFRKADRGSDWITIQSPPDLGETLHLWITRLRSQSELYNDVNIYRNIFVGNWRHLKSTCFTRNLQKRIIALYSYKSRFEIYLDGNSRKNDRIWVWMKIELELETRILNFFFNPPYQTDL